MHTRKMTTNRSFIGTVPACANYTHFFNFTQGYNRYRINTIGITRAENPLSIW